MNAQLNLVFRHEIEIAKSALKSGEWERAYHHLERAHVLGQRYVWPHTYCHVLFLKLGWARRDIGEIIGQFLRIVLGAVGSVLNRVPVGNTGGANVNMFRRMPIAEDLRQYLND